MTAPGVHVPDHRLLGLVDGELTSSQAASVDAHLADCASCARRRMQLTKQLDRLARVLGEADWTAPPRTVPAVTPRASRRGWWQAAAVVAVLLAGGLTVQPLRALIMKTARAGWEGIATIFAREQPAAPRPVPSASFPAGSRLTVRFDEQASGRLSIEVTDEPLATVENTGPGTQLVVLPDELRIAGVVPVDQPIRLRIPPNVREVQVRDGSRIRRFQPGGIGDRWMVELTGSR